MADYLKEAFLFRWNLLLFAGGAAAAALTPFPDVLLPLVGAGELTYLAGLVSVPRFRAAIDAKVHAARQGAGATRQAPQTPPVSLGAMLGGLPPLDRTRFERLHSRCLEMRKIAAGVRGAAGDQTTADRGDHARRASIACCGCSCGCSSRAPRSIGFCRR